MVVLSLFLLAVLHASLTIRPASAFLGPISTAAPNLAGGKVANTAPPNTFFQGFQPPFPTTGDWWVGFAAGNGDAFAAGPYPYQSKCLADGVHFGISAERDFDGVSIHQPTQEDWSVGFKEHSGNFVDHKAKSWDTQTVTVLYSTGSGTMTVPMVPGSPYMTFVFSNATPLIKTQNGQNISLNGKTVSSSVSATAAKFKLTNTAGTYIIYSLSGNLTLTASSSGIITASSPFNGVLRLVKLNATSHETTLDTYYQTYPTGVQTDFSFAGDNVNANLYFRWFTSGNVGGQGLLQLTWPHHRKSLVGQAFLPSTSISYLTTKGYMLGTVGSNWTFAYTLPQISWNAPRLPDASCTNLVLQGLKYEVAALVASTPPTISDFYFWGGTINAKARLALIADHLGQTALRDSVVTWLKQAFQPWLDGSAPTQAAYETNWGGVVDKAGASDVNIDFGNGFYNDHHFHYGYFLAIAGVIAKFDTTWGNTNREYINFFARDIANPSQSSDPYFTPTRNRDWFAGHSWASGIANGAGSRDQESTGEAINGYYGVLLWADATGQTDLKHYANLLIATEMQGAQTYWHLYPSSDPNGRDQPYPEQGLRNLVTIGNVEDWQSGAWLFWGNERVEIAAIQMLPVTPINENLYDAAWINAMWNYSQVEINDPTYSDDWKSVIYCALSNVDAKTAAAFSSNLGSWGSGNTYTNQLYFISTRPSSSGICSSAFQFNPTGNFTLREVSSNRYVTSSSANVNLYANTTSAANATVYTLGFAPGGGTIYAANNAQYVTADSSGNFTLGAARTVASTWEEFVIRPKTGAASGVYTILAQSNKMYIVRGSDGGLKNNGATEAGASGFALANA